MNVELNLEYTDGEFQGTCTKIARGWVTLESDEGEVRKFRAGKLEAVTDEEETPDTMAKKLQRYRIGYVRAKTLDGGTTYHNGDPVAKEMHGMDLQQAYRIGAQLLDFTETELLAKYEHLNPGAQRMNIGNRLRSQFKKGNPEVVAYFTATE